MLGILFNMEVNPVLNLITNLLLLGKLWTQRDKHWNLENNPT